MMSRHAWLRYAWSYLYQFVRPSSPITLLGMISEGNQNGHNIIFNPFKAIRELSIIFFIYDRDRKAANVANTQAGKLKENLSQFTHMLITAWTNGFPTFFKQWLISLDAPQEQ